MNYNRRNFIKTGLIASAGTYLLPGFLNDLKAANPLINGKKLVIIQLSGGNDGLNTIVPLGNDVYHQLRPEIGLSKTDVISLENDLFINSSLKEIADCFHAGELSIINGVGYPNPNRSHFRSMDIWQSASDSDVHLNTGWIGRYLDAECNSSHYAIEADDSLSLAVKGEKIKGLAVKDLKRLKQTTESKKVKLLAANDYKTIEPGSLSFMYKTVIETKESAEYLNQKVGSYRKAPNRNYPTNEFGKKLNMIGDLISSGVDTTVFYADLTGFDTHVRQNPQQNRLLSIYSQGVYALKEHLKDQGQWENTLILTFSEFGRRVKQNGSSGTDHGTANSVFMISGDISKPGIYNSVPSLNNLDDGDLMHTIDFRQVYATVLEKWLNTNSTQILGNQFKALDILS